MPGSRWPRRFRFGPLRNRIFIELSLDASGAIVDANLPVAEADGTAKNAKNAKGEELRKRIEFSSKWAFIDS